MAITPPLRVLDLGCGDGTTAIPLARAGVEVVGIDIARNLIEAGNKRAAEAGLSRLAFQEGDACNLEGVADHSFDMTVSVFGLCLRQALRCCQGDGARYELEAVWGDLLELQITPVLDDGEAASSLAKVHKK